MANKDIHYECSRGIFLKLMRQRCSCETFYAYLAIRCAVYIDWLNIGAAAFLLGFLKVAETAPKKFINDLYTSCNSEV